VNINQGFERDMARIRPSIVWVRVARPPPRSKRSFFIMATGGSARGRFPPLAAKWLGLRPCRGSKQSSRLIDPRRWLPNKAKTVGQHRYLDRCRPHERALISVMTFASAPPDAAKPGWRKVNSCIRSEKPQEGQATA
jgi:hypothetical protein